MSKRRKYLFVVMAAQVLCVAIGLWVEHRHLDGSLRMLGEEQVWKELHADGERVAAMLAGGGGADRSLSSVSLADATGAVTSGRFVGSAQLTLVQADWTVLADSGGEGNRTGVHLTWEPAPPERVTFAQATVGTLRDAEGDRLAAALAVDGGRGHLVVSRPRNDAMAWATAAGAVTPLVSALTWAWTCALLGITTFMILARFHDEYDRERLQGDSQALRRIESLVRTRDAVIFGLAKLADSRDPETGDHLERISLYASTLASTLSRHPHFCDVVSSTFVRLIGVSSALHDIGKVGIEDSILRKPGQLTDEERRRMQEHTRIGGRCLEEIEQRLGSSNFLQMAREIALAHHERWDGTGYPAGLVGEQIPLAARIVAITDVYDALSSRRVYKPPLPHERCVEMIREAAGKQFDPRLVEVWLSIAPRFHDIAQQYGEEEAEAPAPRAGASPRPDVARPVVAATT